MVRRLALAGVIALFPAIASAQFAVIAPTPPTLDNGDRIATTAWVNNFVNAGLPLASGKIWIGSVGNIATAQTMSGDATLSIAGVLTLATVNANTGAFGSATQCVTVTNNAKGLTTAVSAATCTPAIGSITGLGTGVATALGINIGSAGAPVLFNGAGGTPSAIALTNGTGLPISGVTGLGTGVAAALAIAPNTAGGFAPVTSPAFGGTPTAPTAAASTNTTQIATTAGIVAERAATRTSTNQTIDTAGPNTLKVNGVDVSTAWTTYTPAPTCGTATFTVNAARFKTIGKTTFLNIDITIATLGTCTTNISFTLPATSNSSGGLSGRESVISAKAVACAFTGTSTTAACSLADASNFAGTERIAMSGVYESQ